MPVKIAIEVAAAVVIHQGRVLLAKRQEGSLAGFWEFPGGKLEPTETFSEAAERELVEELSLSVTAHERLLIIEHEYPDKRVRLHFVHCFPVSDPDEIPVDAANDAMAGWFDPHGKILPPLCPADQTAWKQMPWTRLLPHPASTNAPGKD